ncbi:MAG: glycosyltransferase family 4 protein [Cyanobacteria bacterium]|nr:glycosyltransferase family 4 protein [Cyanobacteriota bacterium]
MATLGSTGGAVAGDRAIAPRPVRFLIQYHHGLDELNGVVTYVHTLDRTLRRRGLETRLISTKATGLGNWIAAIAWADVVHLNSNHLGFAILCKLLGKKTVIKYHYLLYQSAHWHYEPMGFWRRLRVEYKAAFPPRTAPLKWQLFVIVKFLRLAVRLATVAMVDRHTACSQFLGESCSLPMAVTTVYNPIELEGDAPPKTLADLAEPHTFTFAGRVVRDKGPAVLLAAARILAERGRSFRVVLLGDGPSRAALEADVAAWGLGDRVEFLGWQSREAVLAQMGRSLAVVAPSQWQDPAPYVAMEAASQQTASIVARVGGLPEMVGDHGWIFTADRVDELADLMEGCLQDPAGAIARGRKAYEYTRATFSSDRAADTLLEVCAPLLPPKLRPQLAPAIAPNAPQP